MNLIEQISELPLALRILSILLLAVLAQVSVSLLRRFGEWILRPKGMRRETVLRLYPKFATITTIVVSALSFVIYFGAFGFVLQELGVSLTVYVASASVIGLAVAFGSQGLVQDVVIGLTLIFSNVLNVGEMVDISGQTGRVERIGLRFTTLVNLLNQQVYIPNRNIALINRYHEGHIRAFVDVQLPEGVPGDEARQVVEPIALGMHVQHGAVVLAPPEILGVYRTEPGGWHYLRIQFRLWPGQGALVENTFRQRSLAAMRKLDAGYADWMITVTYRA